MLSKAKSSLIPAGHRGHRPADKERLRLLLIIEIWVSSEGVPSNDLGVTVLVKEVRNMALVSGLLASEICLVLLGCERGKLVLSIRFGEQEFPLRLTHWSP